MYQQTAEKAGSVAFDTFCHSIRKLESNDIFPVNAEDASDSAVPLSASKCPGPTLRAMFDWPLQSSTVPKFMPVDALYLRQLKEVMTSSIVALHVSA